MNFKNNDGGRKREEEKEMSFKVTNDYDIMTIISKAKRNGYDRIKIDVESIENYTDTIYGIYSVFEIKPSIDVNGFIICNIRDDKYPPLAPVPSTVAVAREFLTPIFEELLDNICSSEDYTIPISNPVREIIKYYSWFDFNSALLKRGYSISVGYKYQKWYDGWTPGSYKCIRRILGQDNEIPKHYIGEVGPALDMAIRDNKVCTVKFDIKETHKIRMFKAFLDHMKITGYHCEEVGWIFKSYHFQCVDIVPILWLLNSDKFRDVQDVSLETVV